MIFGDCHLQELVTKVFQQLWFTPAKDEDDESRLQAVIQMTDVVSLYSCSVTALFINLKKENHGGSLQNVEKVSLTLSVPVSYQHQTSPSITHTK